MKRIDPSAFQTRKVMDLLDNATAPMTLDDISIALDMSYGHAKSLLHTMRLTHRIKWITMKRVKYYGPVKK